MSTERDNAKQILSGAKTFKQGEAQRREEEAVGSAKSLLKKETDKLNKKIQGLSTVYQVMKTYYEQEKNKTALAENEALKTSFLLYAILIDNLSVLYKHVDKLQGSTLNLQALETLTTQVKKFNDVLSGTYHTTAFYEFARILNLAYPRAWNAFIVLFPIDLIPGSLLIAAIVTGLISSQVGIPILAALLVLNLIVPIFAGINELTKQQLGANPLEVESNKLLALSNASADIDEKYYQVNNRKSRSAYASYQPVFASANDPENAKSNSVDEKQASFLSSSDVSLIKVTLGG